MDSRNLRRLINPQSNLYFNFTAPLEAFASRNCSLRRLIKSMNCQWGLCYIWSTPLQIFLEWEWQFLRMMSLSFIKTCKNRGLLFLLLNLIVTFNAELENRYLSHTILKVRLQHILHSFMKVPFFDDYTQSVMFNIRISLWSSLWKEILKSEGKNRSFCWNKPILFWSK